MKLFPPPFQDAANGKLQGGCGSRAGIVSISRSGTPLLHGNQPRLGLTLVFPGLELEEGGNVRPQQAFLDLHCCGLELVFSQLGQHFTGECMHACTVSWRLLCGLRRKTPMARGTSWSFSSRLSSPFRRWLYGVTLEGALGHLFYKL